MSLALLGVAATSRNCGTAGPPAVLSAAGAEADARRCGRDASHCCRDSCEAADEARSASSSSDLRLAIPATWLAPAGHPTNHRKRCQSINSMVSFYYVVFEQQAANLPTCTSDLSVTMAGCLLLTPTCHHHAADDDPGSHARHVRPNTLCHVRPRVLPGHHHVRDAAKVTVQPAAGSTVVTGRVKNTHSLCAVLCCPTRKVKQQLCQEGASCNGRRSAARQSGVGPPAGRAVPRSSSHVDDVGCCQVGCDHLPPVLLRCDAQG